ncbi:MAG: N-methyl-L-tryptophan oxidase [Candidatus Eremiobacteraeota bacterium]|nr:N-methyl-L-tryptophan oxidase [Candidatus Eremiobacteraeota bacterium]
MRSDFRYIVLGLGGIGSAATYWLSRRAGADVLGLEQFSLGHSRGESQDHSRIIRLSYHRPDYVALAKRAYDAWAQLEADAAEQLVLVTGGLDLGPRRSAIPLSSYADSMRACNVHYEEIDAAEIMRRWPPFRVADDVHGLFQEQSGIAMAARATAAHQRLARAHGATLIDNAPVASIVEHGGEYDVSAGGRTYRCSTLVIAAGPWSNRMLGHFRVRLPLEVTKEQVTYFQSPDGERFAPGRFPVWIWMDDPSFYGTPIFGENGPKVAQDAGGKPVDPDTRDFEVDADNLARVLGFVERYLPSMLGPIIYTKTCLYTLPPDRDFIVGAIPGQRHAFMAIGAGHAFKFASALGRILSELACDDATPADISGFSFERPILQQVDPPKSYMV